MGGPFFLRCHFGSRRILEEKSKLGGSFRLHCAMQTFNLALMPGQEKLEFFKSDVLRETNFHRRMFQYLAECSSDVD